MKPNTIQLIGPDGECINEQPLDTMVENLKKQIAELYPKGLTVHIGGTKLTVEESRYFIDEKGLLVYFI